MATKRITELEELTIPSDDYFFFVDSLSQGSKKISYANLGARSYKKVTALPTHNFDFNMFYLIPKSNPTTYHNYDKYMLLPENIVQEDDVIAYDVTEKIDANDIQWIDSYEGMYQAYGTIWTVKQIQFFDEIEQRDFIYYLNLEEKFYYPVNVIPEDTDANLAELIGNWEIFS